MKMLWSGIRSIVNFKSNVGCSISSLTRDGFKVDGSKEMANIFNEVFVNTAKTSMRKFQEQRNHP